MLVGVAGCKPAASSERREEVGPSPITAPADYVNASFQAGEKAKGTVGLMALNKAVSMYRMQKGANPPSLEVLQQEGFVPEIPPAPRGQAYRYDQQTGQVTLAAK